MATDALTAFLSNQVWRPGEADSAKAKKAWDEMSGAEKFVDHANWKKSDMRAAHRSEGEAAERDVRDRQRQAAQEKWARQRYPNSPVSRGYDG